MKLEKFSNSEIIQSQNAIQGGGIIADIAFSIKCFFACPVSSHNNGGGPYGGGNGGSW